MFALVGAQFLFIDGFVDPQVVQHLLGAGAVAIGALLFWRSRSLGLWVFDDSVVLRNFLFTVDRPLSNVVLVIDDSQSQTSVYKFAVLQVLGADSYVVNRISWTGSVQTSPNLKRLINDVSARGLAVRVSG